MLYSLLGRGAEIWTETRILRLVEEDGRVWSAPFWPAAARRGRSAPAAASCWRRAAFPTAREMRDELSSDFPHDITFGFEGNVGDGIKVAREIGAVLDRDLASTGYWQPSSKRKLRDGSEEAVLYGYLDRGRPGVVAVDRTGRRFVNESNSYHDVGLALIKAGIADGNRFHFVCDSAFVWHHGLGMIRPFSWNLRKYERSGYITLADTVPDLARKIGVDPDGLARTIRDHNAYAETGVDPEFGKGSTAYNRLFGHPRAKGPNKNLAPIEKPPFVALRIYPGTLGTAVGLKVTGDAQVVRGDGAPIPGLYACGNDMASMMRGCYPAGGITLGPAIAFAYRAARHAIAGRHARPHPRAK